MGLRDLGKAIKGALVEDDGAETTPKGEAEEPEDDNEKQPKRTSASVPAVRRVSSGPADEQYLTILTGQVEKSAKPGYAEFAGQLEALAEDIPDEARRYKAALKSAARAHGSLDKDAVLAAIDDRITILEGAAAQFTAEVDADEKKRIGTAEADLASVEEQIAELSKSRDAMRSELESNRARFASKREKFAGAHAALSERLAAERKKVETYLQG